MVILSRSKFLLALFVVLSQTAYAQQPFIAKPSSVNNGRHVQRILTGPAHPISGAAMEEIRRSGNTATQVSYLSPRQNQTDVPLNTEIEVHFATSPDTLSLSRANIKIFGDQTGEYHFNHFIVYDAQNDPIGVRLEPNADFKVGERIQIILTKRIRFADSTQFHGFVWEFTCETRYGSGQFSHQTNIYTGSQFAAWHIASGDLDNDGDIDIVTANPTEEIAVLLNDGSGGFSANATYSVPGFPVFVSLADYNRDQFLDISVVSDSNLYVFPNNGDATFGSPDVYLTPHPSRPWERAWSIANADMDRDGYIDIIVSNVNGGSFDIFYNDSSGGFIRQSIYVTLPATPEHLTTTDFDKDGDFDILFSDNFAHTVNVYLYENGGFPYTMAIFVNGELNSIYCNDFSSEGDTDILLGTGFYSPADNKIIMILRDGQNTQTYYYPVLMNPNYAIGSDVNSDGFLDVISAHNAPTAFNNISILLNDGSGLLLPPEYVGDNVYSPFAVTAADFNGDETIDFAAANAGASWVSVFFNDAVVAIGKEVSRPIGRFELEQNFPNPFNPLTNIEFRIMNSEFTTLKIYDLSGREVKTLVSGQKAAGSYTVQWDGTNNAGQPAASGVYLYRLQAGKYTAMRKMLLVR